MTNINKHKEWVAGVFDRAAGKGVLTTITARYSKARKLTDRPEK